MTDQFYSFDTSAILNGRPDLFRPTVFQTLWTQIEGAIVAGQIRSVDEVRNELHWAPLDYRASASNAGSGHAAYAVVHE